MRLKCTTEAAVLILFQEVAIFFRFSSTALILQRLLTSGLISAVPMPSRRTLPS